MKSIKMMLLMITATMGIISTANGFYMKDYLTGSQRDKEGKTLIHIAAENCDDLDRFAEVLVMQNFVLALTEPDLKISKEEVSVSAKDNKGRTAFDIAKRRYEQTKHSDCALAMLDLKEAMEKEGSLESDNK